jgi:hypothetical protein
MRCNFAIIWTVLLFAGLGTTYGDLLTVDLPEFERLYGGFTGDTFQETTYDFGTSFSTVTSATLHLEGFTDISDTTISFLIELEGVTTPTVDLFVTGAPLFPPYSIDIPLLFDANVLDGTGLISMDINTSGPGADLSTTVQSASLTFEGVSVPEPSAVIFFFIGGFGLLFYSSARRRLDGIRQCNHQN